MPSMVMLNNKSGHMLNDTFETVTTNTLAGPGGRGERGAERPQRDAVRLGDVHLRRRKQVRNRLLQRRAQGFR